MPSDLGHLTPAEHLAHAAELADRWPVGRPRDRHLDVVRQLEPAQAGQDRLRINVGIPAKELAAADPVRPIERGDGLAGASILSRVEDSRAQAGPRREALGVVGHWGCSLKRGHAGGRRARGSGGGQAAIRFKKRAVVTVSPGAESS